MIVALLIIPLIGVLFLLPIGTKNSYKNMIAGSFVLSQGSQANYALNSQSKVEELSGSSIAASRENMKKIALFFSLLNFLISIIMWFQFDFNSTSYQFVYEFNQLKFCHFHVGIDGIALYFVLLTTFITPICILSN